MAADADQVYTKLSDMIENWQTFTDLQRDWLGGPSAALDTGSEYPGKRWVSDSTGNTYLLDTPAELLRRVEASIAALTLNDDPATVLQNVESALTQLETLQTQVAADSSAVSQAVIDSETALSQATAVQTQLDGIEASLIAYQNAASVSASAAATSESNAASDASSAQASMTAALGHATNASNALAQITQTLNDAQTLSDSLDASILQVQNNVVSASNYAAAASDSLTATQAIEASVGTMVSDMATMESNVIALHADIQTIETDLLTLQSDVDAVGAAITSSTNEAATYASEASGYATNAASSSTLANSYLSQTIVQASNAEASALNAESYMNQTQALQDFARYAFAGASVKATSLAVTDGGQTITFDTEVFDTGLFFDSASADRLTVYAGSEIAKVVLSFSGQVDDATDAITGEYQILIAHYDSADNPLGQYSSGAQIGYSYLLPAFTTPVIPVSSGDYFRVTLVAAESFQLLNGILSLHAVDFVGSSTVPSIDAVKQKSVKYDGVAATLPNWAAWLVDSTIGDYFRAMPASPEDGEEVSVIDIGNNASVNNITLTVVAPTTINDAVMNINGQSNVWRYDATNDVWDLVLSAGSSDSSTQNNSTIIDVNGGVAVSLDQRFEIDILTEVGADFVDKNLMVIAEIYNASGDGIEGWGDPGWVHTSSGAFGVKASVFGDKIIVQTADYALTGYSNLVGNPFNNASSVFSDMLCRVRVLKVD